MAINEKLAVVQKILNIVDNVVHFVIGFLETINNNVKSA